MKMPFLVFCVSFVVLWLSARMGASLRKQQVLDEDTRHDLDVIVAATLTLLGLIIGFSFSMATSRYDQRKNYEEAEANAIGTEYVRADLLPAADAARVRTLLSDYLDQRVLFYQTRDDVALRQINDATARLQSDLWFAVRAPADARPTPELALTLSGMNDVLNSQGYTQAAWWNRIPVAAWVLMATIAICANLIFGYGARVKRGAIQMLILPFVLSIAFFLIADIDSPRRGVIRVNPQNLVSLVQALHPR
jgi:predicted membrane protein